MIAVPSGPIIVGAVGLNRPPMDAFPFAGCRSGREDGDRFSWHGLSADSRLACTAASCTSRCRLPRRRRPAIGARQRSVAPSSEVGARRDGGNCPSSRTLSSARSAGSRLWQQPSSSPTAAWISSAAGCSEPRRPVAAARPIPSLSLSLSRLSPYPYPYYGYLLRRTPLLRPHGVAVGLSFRRGALSLRQAAYYRLFLSTAICAKQLPAQPRQSLPPRRPYKPLTASLSALTQFLLADRHLRRVRYELEETPRFLCARALAKNDNRRNE